MIDEFNEEAHLRQEIKMSKDAKHVKGFLSPIFKEMQEALFEQFIQSDASNTERLQVIKLQMGAVRTLENILTNYMVTGEMARDSLKKYDN